MPERITSWTDWILGGVAFLGTLVVGYLGYHTKNTFVKKTEMEDIVEKITRKFLSWQDLQEHCKNAQNSCNRMVCAKLDSFDKSQTDKIDMLRKGQSAVFDESAKMRSEVLKMNEQLNRLIGRFDQYQNDQNK